MLVIRKASNAEVREWSERSEAHEPFIDFKPFKRHLADAETVFFVAEKEHGGKRIQVGLRSLHPSTGMFGYVYAAPGHRRENISRKLNAIATVHSFEKHPGLKEVRGVLDVESEELSEAKRAYRNQGFFVNGNKFSMTREVYDALKRRGHFQQLLENVRIT